ncbi:hypothetical protein COP2_007050 [Malus domestica]
MQIATKTPSLDEISPERFHELIVELDCEQQAREAVENSKLDLQVQFNLHTCHCNTHHRTNATARPPHHGPVDQLSLTRWPHQKG